MKIFYTHYVSAALVIAAALLPAQASAYSSIVAFGDSLSDNGNFNLILNPSYSGSPVRPSNGPVAVEIMASTLGVPLFDYAVTGAETGVDLSGKDNSVQLPGLFGTGMTAQVNNYIAGRASVDANALYFIWGGSNDLNGYARSDYSIVANNITAMITQLADKGATSFFIPNLIDMGLDPYFTGDSKAQQTQDSIFFNTLFSSIIYDFSVAHPALNIQYFDYFALEHNLMDNAPVGFNTSEACKLNAACLTNPDIAKNYFFWDEFHPTGTIHNVIGTQFANAAFQPPVVQPPVVQPPVVQPPVVQPPVVQPPVVQPPVVQPTVVQPTVVQPTVVQPTVVQPTVVQPPLSQVSLPQSAKPTRYTKPSRLRK